MTGETDDLRNTIAAIVSDAQDWDNGTEPYVERIMGAIAAERERQAAEIARLRAERDGIRADQQRAVAANLSLGSEVWCRAMLHAANIASQMRASGLLVRALKDRATLPTPTADKEG